MKREVAAEVLGRFQYCPWCGRLLQAPAIHHRQLRSQGGDDSVDNLVAVHHECHNLGTRSIHLNVREAQERGFIVPSWANPAEVPLRLVNGQEWMVVSGEQPTEMENYPWATQASAPKA